MLCDAGASQVSRDDADARDNVTRRVAYKAMKSLENFSDGRLVEA